MEVCWVIIACMIVAFVGFWIGRWTEANAWTKLLQEEEEKPMTSPNAMTNPNAQYRCYTCGGMSEVDADCISKLTEAEPSCTFLLDCALCGTTNSVTLRYDEVMSDSTADLGCVYASNEPKKKEVK